MQISQLKNISNYPEVSKDNVIALLSQLTTCYNSNNEIITDRNYKNLFSFIPNTHQIYVIIDNDFLIGMGTLLIENKIIHGGKSVGHIEDIVIDKKYRGQSYGKLLIDYLTEKARDLDCYKVILNCSEDHVAFYEKSGFSQTSVCMSKYFE